MASAARCSADPPVSGSSTGGGTGVVTPASIVGSMKWVVPSDGVPGRAVGDVADSVNTGVMPSPSGFESTAGSVPSTRGGQHVASRWGEPNAVVAGAEVVEYVSPGLVRHRRGDRSPVTVDRRGSVGVEQLDGHRSRGRFALVAQTVAVLVDPDLVADGEWEPEPGVNRRVDRVGERRPVARLRRRGSRGFDRRVRSPG